MDEYYDYLINFNYLKCQCFQFFYFKHKSNLIIHQHLYELKHQEYLPHSNKINHFILLKLDSFKHIMINLNS